MNPDSSTLTAPKRERIVVRDDSAISHLMDTGRFEHMFRIAGAMASASLIPEHLAGRKKGGNLEPFTAEEIRANCFLIVNQSLRWGMDPFAVMPETYVVGGKLAYQGKLIAAVVNARADLVSRLRYSFTGKKGGDDFTVKVSGTFRGEDQASEVELSVGQAKTQNDIWRKDPEQKLIYSGVVKWARRFCPEIVLGILTEEDAEAIHERSITGRIIESAPKPTAEGEAKPNWMKIKDGEKIETAAEVKAQPEPQAAEAEPVVTAPEFSPYDRLQTLMSADGISLRQVEKFLRESRHLRTTMPVQHLGDLPEKLILMAIDGWDFISSKLKDDAAAPQA